MLDPTSITTTPITPGPREVVASFLRLTVDTPNLEKAKLHLSKRSLKDGDFHAAPAGSSYTLGAEEADELGARIPVAMKSPVPGTTEMQEMTVPMIVVQEDGGWKVDLPATMERLMGPMTAALGEVTQKMGEALATVMEGMGQALAAGLGSEGAAAAPTEETTPAKKPSAKPVVKKAAKPAKAAAAKKPAKKVPAKKVPAKKVPAKKAGKKKPAKPAKKSAKKAARKAGKKRR